MGIYFVPVVGERSYQSAIARVKVGEAVRLRPEPENPHDPRAIQVIGASNEVIGYLPRDGWLTDLVLRSGEAPLAQIKSVNGGKGKHLGVVLIVATKGEDLKAASDLDRTKGSRKKSTSGLAKFMAGLIKGLTK